MPGAGPPKSRYEESGLQLRPPLHSFAGGTIVGDTGKIAQTTILRARRSCQAGRRLGKRHLQKLLVAVGRGCLRGANTAEEKVGGCCARKAAGLLMLRLAVLSHAAPRLRGFARIE